MSDPQPGTQAWLDQVTEDIIEPARPIIDPHHHLWRRRGLGTYLLDDLWADTGSGHNIEKTVFLECGASYHESGPEHLKPVGETEFVAEIAEASRKDPSQVTIAAIVGRTDLRLGNHLDEVLDAHEEAGHGLFRGIRHAGARAEYPEVMFIAGNAPAGLLADENFRSGVRRLGERGLTYESWHYHHQNREFLDLALAAPDTPIILDHFGTPVGVGPYADQREAIFAAWQDDIAAIAQACPNVYAKLGGLAMPDNGFGWHTRATPATSDEFVSAQGRYYLHMIECFGPTRCMFESNFPVDRLSISYAVLYNGLKKIAADFTEEEKHAMFYGTAERVYKL
jgi:predicted TIM-barrel fold metal-dependent hydrolase